MKQNSYAVGLDSVENVSKMDAGVDAVSQVLEGEEGKKNYQELADLYVTKAKELGIKPYVTKVGSYQGKRFGDVFLGAGLNRYYVAVTGKQAEHVFALTMGCPGYYTRLDLQITVEFKVPQPDYVERQYQRWISHGHPGHSPKQAKFVQSSSGSTLYLGTRQNDTYYRLYDKSTWYNQELGTSLRFECEYHREKADDVAFTIATANNFQKAVSSLVFGSWHLADIRVPVSLLDPLSPLRLGEKVKGSEHYLEWLKTSVKPVVVHLRSLGLDDKIGEVLGLQSPLDL